MNCSDWVSKKHRMFVSMPQDFSHGRVNAALKVCLQKKTLSVTQEFRLLQWIFSVKWKKEESGTNSWEVLILHMSFFLVNFLVLGLWLNLMILKAFPSHIISVIPVPHSSFGGILHRKSKHNIYHNKQFLWISSFFPFIMHQGLRFNSHFCTNWGKPSAWRNRWATWRLPWVRAQLCGHTGDPVAWPPPAGAQVTITSPASCWRREEPDQRTHRWHIHRGPDLEFQHQEQRRDMEQVQRHFEWHQQDQQHQLTSGLWINHFTGHNCGLVTSPSK